MLFALTLVRLFGTISHNILIEKVTKYGLGKSTVRWTEKCLNSWAHRVVITATKSRGRPVNSSVPKRSVLEPILLNIFFNNLNDGTECTFTGFADNTRNSS